MRVKLHVRWEPQEEGMMSVAASFPQYETEVIEPVGDEDTSEGVNGARKSVVAGSSDG